MTDATVSLATGPMWAGFIVFVLTMLALYLFVFIGGKMLVMPWFHMPIQLSLTIVGSIIVVSVLASLALSKPKSNSQPVVLGEEA